MSKLLIEYTTDNLISVKTTLSEEIEHFTLLKKGTVNPALERMYKSRIQVREDAVSKITQELDRRERAEME